MKHVYRKLRVDEISFVDKGASPGARVTFWKRRFGVEKNMNPNLDQILAKLSDDEKKQVLTAIEEAGKPKPPAGPVAPVASAAPPHPQPSTPAAPTPPAMQQHPPVHPPLTDAQKEEQALKSLPESVQKKLRDAEELSVRVAKMEEDNLTREYVTKAQKLAYVPQLTTGELAEVLKTADRGRPLTKELGAKLAKALASANEMISKSRDLGEIGTLAAGSGEVTAEGRLEVIAKSLRDKEPKLTKEQAYAKALKENPELYAEYERENPPQVMKAR